MYYGVKGYIACIVCSEHQYWTTRGVESYTVRILMRKVLLYTLWCEMWVQYEVK